MATATASTPAPAPPEKVSRYKSLRGKSVSAPRGTNLLDFDDEDGNGNGDGDTFSIARESSKRNRRRSKSVALMPTISTFPRVPPLPPTPLSMTSNNLAGKSSSLLRRQKTVENINAAAANANSRFDIGEGAGTTQVPGTVSGTLNATGSGRIEGGAAAQPTATSPGHTDGGVGTTEISPVDAGVAPTGRPETGAGNRAPGAPSGTIANRLKDEEEAARWAAEVARLEAETDRILAEQKKKDLVRLQIQLAAAAAAAAAHKPRSPILEKFTFLTKRRTNTTSSPTSSSTPSIDFSRSNATSIDQRMGIEPSRKLVVPLSEAPASAINSSTSERRVAVRCKQSTLDLPVEWETTTLDILFSSASCLNRMLANINPSTSLLIETFSSMGLERRLRRYEQIRDIMNSWDKDTQNTLIVIPQDSVDGDQDLDIASVPQSSVAPNGFTLYLYHSQKPGKWTKRYITLMETGQMYASKKPEFKLPDKDCHPICHLSDFDIYTPTEAQMRRHLKPPKKFCYAIKSQQKTGVFLNMDSYIHYFCTEDPNMAQRFHALVHGWRSWYLVNKSVELAIKKKTTAPKITSLKHKPQKSLNVVNVNGHRLKVSVDEAPYAVGTFQPLIDIKRFDKPIDEFGKDFLPDPKRPPPQDPAPSTPIKSRGRSKTLVQSDDSKFMANGLLGDSYEARKVGEVEKKREAAQIQEKQGDTTPFTGGDTLLNMANSPERSKEEDKKSNAKPWFPSASEHTARARAQTQARSALESRPSTSGGHPPNRPPPDFSGRFGPQTGLKPSASIRGDGRRPMPGRPKPLVDLSPTFQEAPQWRNQGGHGVRAPAGVHLVDLISTGQAQGPNKFLEVPPRSIIRRDTSSSSTGSGSSNHQMQDRDARSMHRLAPSAGRQRSRSLASSNQGGNSMPGGGARRPADGQPPVPPLPLRAREIEVRRPSTRDGADRRARDLRVRGRSGTIRQ